MTNEEDFDAESRVERAANLNIEFSTASRDPLVVQAKRESSENESEQFTVIPDELLCDCLDDADRDAICEHQIALALQDDWRGATMREAIGDRFKEVQDEMAEVRQQLDDLESQARMLNELRGELGERTSVQPTDPENVRSEEERTEETREVLEEAVSIAEKAGDERAAERFRRIADEVESDS